MRADARRNYERLLAAADEVFSERGVDASLEEVARRAGVGIGTFYRHFPSRRELTEALVRDWAEDLARQARGLAEKYEPAEALAEWLRAIAVHTTRYREMKAALIANGDPELKSYCRDVVEQAGESILKPAVAAGEVRDDVTAIELLRFANAIVLATEKAPDPSVEADRMLDIVLAGIRPT